LILKHTEPLLQSFISMKGQNMSAGNCEKGGNI